MIFVMLYLLVGCAWAGLVYLMTRSPAEAVICVFLWPVSMAAAALKLVLHIWLDGPPPPPR